MTTYSTWYDVHIGGPTSLFKTFDDFLKVLNPDDPNEILGGDIIELVNCHRSDVDKMRQCRAELKRLYGKRYFDGNHEATDIIQGEYVINGIVFRHFDAESWGDFKAEQFRAKRHGASEFKRNTIVPLIEAYEKNHPFRTPDEKSISRAVKIAKDRNCHTYVGGHFHPPKILTIQREVKIMIMPRGKTVFSI